jgi:hypothetical protein
VTERQVAATENLKRARDHGVRFRQRSAPLIEHRASLAYGALVITGKPQHVGIAVMGPRDLGMMPTEQALSLLDHLSRFSAVE